jgi:hypothetical protein
MQHVKKSKSNLWLVDSSLYGCGRTQQSTALTQSNVIIIIIIIMLPDQAIASTPSAPRHVTQSNVSHGNKMMMLMNPAHHAHAHTHVCCMLQFHLKSVALNSARLMTDTWPPLHGVPSTPAKEQLP